MLGYYRVLNKWGDIFSRLLIQLGIFFLLYYGRVLDAKGCQFIASFSVLWNSTFLKLLIDQDILNCPALSCENIADPSASPSAKTTHHKERIKSEIHFNFHLEWFESFLFLGAITSLFWFPIPPTDYEATLRFHEFNVTLGCWDSMFQVEFHKIEYGTINWQPFASKTRP